MNYDKILVTIFGIAAIVFTYWFFLMKKSRAVTGEGEITVTVDGGYSPETIAVQKGKPITITFLRTDPSSCLEEVVLPAFKVRKFLPLHTPVAVTIVPNEAGEFPFSCGMSMFHGKFVVT